MIHLRCPECGAKDRRDGFRARGQFCSCGWWRDRPDEKGGTIFDDAARLFGPNHTVDVEGLMRDIRGDE